jgi:hypothetical protein
VQSAHCAAIFGIEYSPSPSESRGAQVALVLVTLADSSQPQELHLVQYVANPSRMGFDALKPKVRRWENRFRVQATILAR